MDVAILVVFSPGCGVAVAESDSDSDSDFVAVAVAVAVAVTVAVAVLVDVAVAVAAAVSVAVAVAVAVAAAAVFDAVLMTAWMFAEGDVVPVMDVAPICVGALSRLLESRIFNSLCTRSGVA
jgi:hypothetical protein